MKHGHKLNILAGLVAILLLLPITLNAGSLEPTGAPASTMRTLDEVYSTGSWSRKIPCDVGNCPRFEVLADFNNEAVLDKETGLVWEKSPDATKRKWFFAITRCWTVGIGDRGGWRLPSVEELSSILDKTQTSPSLPVGHSFTNIQGYPGYWSSTSIIGPGDTWTDSTYGMDFSYGGVWSARKGYEAYVWCVRGGASHDGYLNE